MRAIAWLAAVIATACLVVWFTQDAEGDSALTSAVSAATSRPPVAEEAAAESRPVSSAPAERRIVAAASASLSVIRGRCVDAESQTPLAWCDVKLKGWLRNRSALAGAAPAEAWQDVVATTTEDGLFSLSFAAPPPFMFVLEVGAEGRAPMQATWTTIEPGQTVDVGDVELSRGARVTGRVTDEGGAPVPAVTLSLNSGRRAPRGTMASQAFRVRSNGDGTFEFDAAIPAGTWTLRVDGERELIDPKQVVLEEGKEAARFDVVLQRLDPADVVSGTVVDETGAPAVGVELMATPVGRHTGMMMTCRSKPDGSFAIRRKSNAKGPVRLGSPFGQRSEEYETFWGEREFAWGTTEIRLEVKRTGGVDLFVVEAATGSPVTEYGVRCMREGAGGSEDAKTRGHGIHENGKMHVTGVAFGRNLLMVFPLAEDLLPSEPVYFERAAAGTAPVRVELQRKLPLAVEVVRRDGSPVQRTRLELVALVGAGPLTLDTVSATPGLAYAEVSGPAIAFVWSSAWTDAKGRAVLTGPPARALAIKVLGPGHMARLHENVVLTPGSAPVRIVVETGASIVGRFLPAAVLERLVSGTNGLGSIGPAVRLRERGGGRRMLPDSQAKPFAVAADGSFRIEGIPPGSWDLLFRRLVSVAPGVGSHRLLVAKSVENLTDGEVRDVVIDAEAMLPVKIRGRLLVNGQPFAQQTFALQMAQPDGNGALEPGGWTTGQIATDEQGRFEVEVEPAHYKPIVQLPGEDRYLFVPEWLHVLPKQDVEHTFELSHLRARVRITSSDGSTPIRRRTFGARAEGQWGSGFLETDAEGVLLVDPAPPLPFELVTLPPGIDQAKRRQIMMKDPKELAQLEIRLGPIVIPAGRTEASFELRMPSGKD